MEETRLKEEDENQRQNEAFEKANEQFCGEFREVWHSARGIGLENVLCEQDMKHRKRVRENAESAAQQARLRGNVLYKRGDVKGALHKYLESLKSNPYDARTLANIAQMCVCRWSVNSKRIHSCMSV
jgi:tetratricopeptide (TPR) repeat protein